MTFDLGTSAAAPTSRSYVVPRDTLDDALIARIAAGDNAAMRVLYTRHSSHVYRFILRLISNHATAEDLVNEVFLDVWRCAGKFERRSQVSTWLLAIARNKALGALRARSTEALDDAQEEIEDPEDDPETAIQKKQRGAILFNCIKELSPPHREVVDLVYYHGKTVDEIAEITGIERSTVKTRMFYARKHLAHLLGVRGYVATAL